MVKFCYETCLIISVIFIGAPWILFCLPQHYIASRDFKCPSKSYWYLRKYQYICYRSFNGRSSGFLLCTGSSCNYHQPSWFHLFYMLTFLHFYFFYHCEIGLAAYKLVTSLIKFISPSKCNSCICPITWTLVDNVVHITNCVYILDLENPAHWEFFSLHIHACNTGGIIQICLGCTSTCLDMFTHKL